MYSHSASYNYSIACHICFLIRSMVCAAASTYALLLTLPQPGTRYRLRVSALSQFGSSPPTDWVSITTPDWGMSLFSGHKERVKASNGPLSGVIWNNSP